MKCVLGALGQLKRGFEVVVVDEMCSDGSGAVEKGFEVVALGEMCTERVAVVEQGVCHLW